MAAQIEITHDEQAQFGVAQAWVRAMFRAKKRSYEITRLEEIAGGYLQQHVLRLTSHAGEELVMYACAVVTVADGRIQRIEEYLDPAPTARLAAKPAKG